MVSGRFASGSFRSSPREKSMQRDDPTGDAVLGDAALGDAVLGEPDNAGTLFGKYVRYVAKIGGTILGRNDEVDDVIQDVFLAVHHDLHNLRDAGATKAWIATITVRVARQRLAERWTRRRIAEIPPFELAALTALPASAEHKADLAGRLRAMQEMPPMYRAAWLLKHVDNQPLGRIAALCSCSESTAQRRIRAAESSIRGLGAAQPLRLYAEGIAEPLRADNPRRERRRPGR
jgi:RNA polymerase sigma-70 factor, ECF subfamily